MITRRVGLILAFDALMPVGRRVRRVCLAFLLAAPLGSLAVCLNPFGCEPKSYEECADDASKRPTEVGVRVAVAQCYAIFKKPEDDRRRAEQQASARRLAQRWSSTWKDRSTSPETADTAEELFGKASRTTGPARCSGKSSAPGQCVKFYWDDWTKAPEELRGLGLGLRQPAFCAEFLVGGGHWSHCAESIPIY